MKPGLIVSDWNGTLITDVDDKPVLKQIAMDERGRAVWHLNPVRLLELAGAKKQLEAMVQQYRDDPQSQAELLRNTFELYNRVVLGSIPLSRVRASVEAYASDAVARIDPAYVEFCEVDGMPREVLTSALDEGVVAVMRSYGRSTLGPRHVHGSTIGIKRDWSHGRGGKNVTALTLKNYDKKADALRLLIGQQNNGVSPETTVYIGNDFRDEPCAEVAGRFVVAPLATDDYRQHMAATYGNRVRTPGRAQHDVLKALTMD